MVFVANLLILEYSDHHQNVISSSVYYPGPLHKISLQSVHNLLNNVVHRQTARQPDRQNRQTNATKNITFFAEEVIMAFNICQLTRGTKKLYKTHLSTDLMSITLSQNAACRVMLAELLDLNIFYSDEMDWAWY